MENLLGAMYTFPMGLFGRGWWCNFMENLLGAMYTHPQWNYLGGAGGKYDPAMV